MKEKKRLADEIDLRVNIIPDHGAIAFMLFGRIHYKRKHIKVRCVNWGPRAFVSLHM